MLYARLFWPFCGLLTSQPNTLCAQAIATLNGEKVSGRPVVVDWAVAKSKYEAHVAQAQEQEAGEEIRSLRTEQPAPVPSVVLLAL